MSAAISAGYKRGIATIIDANVVTLLTAFILFVLATAGVKGFAFTLGVGTIVSLLTAVVFTQALLGSMSRTKLLSSPSVLGGAKERRPLALRLHGRQPLVLLALGLHPDHRRPRARHQAAQLRHRLRVRHPDQGRAGQADRRGRRARTRSTASASRRRGDPAGHQPRTRRQRLPDPDADAANRARSKRCRRRSKTNSGSQQNGFDSTSVGPTFGETGRRTAPCNALIFSLLVICAYIAFRFDPKFAVPVLIAIFHDILITAGVYSLTGREVTSGTVAAFLTILGYSLYDTIIVFDRITREHAAHAAGRVLADRQPLDERGADPFAGDQLLDPARRHLAADLRRRDPAGLRLRDAGRDPLRYLLVDLHRLAGPDRLEGTRARASPGAASGSPSSTARSRPSPTTSSWRSSPTTPRPKRTIEAARRRPSAEPEPPAGAVATVEREDDARARSSNGEAAAAEKASAERRERNAERREKRQRRRKHGRNR